LHKAKGEKTMPNLCNSLEEIKNSLAKDVQMTAQNKGVPPKETFLFHNIVLPTNVPNSWDAVDLISHCEIVMEQEVEIDE